MLFWLHLQFLQWSRREQCNSLTGFSVRLEILSCYYLRNFKTETATQHMQLVVKTWHRNRGRRHRNTANLHTRCNPCYSACSCCPPRLARADSSRFDIHISNAPWAPVSQRCCPCVDLATDRASRKGPCYSKVASNASANYIMHVG